MSNKTPSSDSELTVVLIGVASMLLVDGSLYWPRFRTEHRTGHVKEPNWLLIVQNGPNFCEKWIGRLGAGVFTRAA